MNLKKLIFVFVFGFLLVGTLSFASSLQQDIVINYNSTINTTYDSSSDTRFDNYNGIWFSDVMLRIKTENETICRYIEDSFGELSERDYFTQGMLFDNVGLDKLHKKELLGLEEQTYKFYIKCADTYNALPQSGELEVILRINPLVTAEIEIPKLTSGSPLMEGNYEVKVKTSKSVSQTPQVKYSFNGVDENNLVLEGQGEDWIGNIIVAKTMGEGILSFTFKVYDLEGRPGTQILDGNYYLYDTIKPDLITNIEAISYDGKIVLNWESNEEDLKFNIYRSESENPGLIDYYDVVETESFVDTAVKQGTTYYYRITPIDLAGNEGGFSREVFGTSLLETGDASIGLSPNLRGKVDSFLIEVDLARLDLENIKSSLESKSETEKLLFDKLGLNKKLNSIQSGLDAITKDVENYKLQDLTLEELDRRISSSRVKLGVLEKDIPEDILILKKSNREEIIDEDKIVNAIFEIDSAILERDKEKSLKQSLDLIEETGFKVESFFYEVQVVYFSGAKNEYLMVERKITSSMDRNSNVQIIERLPRNLASSIDELKVDGSNEDILGDDTFAFESDVKQIFYYLPGSSFDDLKDIEISLVSMVSKETSSGGITGFFLFEGVSSDYSLMIVGIFLVLAIGAYLFYFRKGEFSDDYFRMVNKVNDSWDKLNEKKLKSSKEIYLTVKSNYLRLPEREKKELYPKINSLYNEILIFEFEDILKLLKQTKDKSLLVKLNKIYNQLPLEFQNKISASFFEIKKDLGV